MGIQKDAGKLMQVIYNQYVNGNSNINPDLIINLTKWDFGRINRSIDFLRDMGLLKIYLFLGNVNGVYNFQISGLTPLGIKIVENNSLFKEYFG